MAAPGRCAPRIVCDDRRELGVDAETGQKAEKGAAQGWYAGGDDANLSLGAGPEGNGDAIAGIVVALVKLVKRDCLDDRGARGDETKAHQDDNDDAVAHRAADLVDKGEGGEGEDDVGEDDDDGGARHAPLEGVGGPAPLVQDGRIPNGLGRDTARRLNDHDKDSIGDLQGDDGVKKPGPSLRLPPYVDEHEGDARLDQGHAPRRHDFGNHGEGGDGVKVLPGPPLGTV